MGKAEKNKNCYQMLLSLITILCLGILNGSVVFDWKIWRVPRLLISLKLGISNKINQKNQRKLY